MGEAKETPRWTPRRLARWTGAVAIVTALFMALFGVYGPPNDLSPKAFWLYWTIFFFFLMCALGLAMIDATITIVTFRKEHADLRWTAREAALHGVKSKHIKETSKGDPNS